MNANQATAPIDMHRQTLEMAADIVEKTDVGIDQLATLLTAEVGHTESEVVYEENKLELHRYAPEEIEHETPILVVYALVNRPYILDLQPDRSVIRRLLDDGYEVYLIKWGEPSILDRSLGLEDYICRYMDNCVDAVCEQSGVDDVHLLGYCMGGSMSIMYTVLFQERVRTLGLMATPLAFDGNGGILERWAAHYDPDVAVETLGNLPAELLAVEFSMMDPIDQYVSKYVRLYENIEDPDFVANFSRMEQWIWDGVDVAGEAYREFINDVYKDNQFIDSEFELGGQRLDLSEIEVPVLQIVGEYDHIVPAASSKPLHDEIASEDDRLIEFPAGHIGISVSSKAHQNLWPEVCEWYAERSARDGEEVTAAVAEETNGHATNIEEVAGIGPTFAERLGEAGIETAADLAEYDPDELADIADTYPSRTEDWLDEVA